MGFPSFLVFIIPPIGWYVNSFFKKKLKKFENNKKSADSQNIVKRPKCNII
nr:MAG TPA: hypothetical protein [Bacteriophage sp.]